MAQPNLGRLEIDITYVCGMNCRNCNRMTGLVLARKEEDITIDQIDRLINESIVLQYPWERWSLVGGEPTMHPGLEQMLSRIGKYRIRYNYHLRVELATHGNGDATRKRLADLSREFPWLVVGDSHKTGPVHPHFSAPCVAPIDIDPEWASSHRFSGCDISSGCGIGLNYAGFYPCAIAGAIDRIFGMRQAVSSLESVSEEVMAGKLQTFCRLCGLYRPICENSQTLLSPTWRNAVNLRRMQATQG